MGKIYAKIGMTGLVLFSLSGCSVSDKETEEKKEVVTIQVENATSESSLTETIEKVKPTVVDVYAYGENFIGAGSGVIVSHSDEGYYIVTNHHVIDEAKEFEIVTYSDVGSCVYDAILIGGSPRNDIAVLKVTTEETWTVATFIEDSSVVKIGQEVIAIGNPLGILGGSVTHGIISATEREVYVEDIGYMRLFQTDAAINSGNSGGALFSYNGLLIGIVNSGYSDYEGLNFAIPANVARKCAVSLIETYHQNGDHLGYVDGETYLGLELKAAALYTDNTFGEQIETVYVSEVNDSGDAANYAIKDYLSFAEGKNSEFYALTKVGDQTISSVKEAQKAIQTYTSGQTISLTFEEIKYARVGGGMISQSVYYLSGTEIKMNIPLSQYIYAI